STEARGDTRSHHRYAESGDVVPQLAAPARGDGARVDDALHTRVSSDVARFIAAFDVLTMSYSPHNITEMLDATDRLLRSAARVRIELERHQSDAVAQQDPPR